MIVSDAIISAYLSFKIKSKRTKDKTELTTWAEVRSGVACFVEVKALSV